MDGKKVLTHCDLSICFVSVALGWLRRSPVLVPTTAFVPVFSSAAPPRRPCSQAQENHHIPMVVHSLVWFVISWKGGLGALSLSWSNFRRGWNYGSFIPNLTCEILTPSWWLNCLVLVNFPGSLCLYLPASRTEKASQGYMCLLATSFPFCTLGSTTHWATWKGGKGGVPRQQQSGIKTSVPVYIPFLPPYLPQPLPSTSLPGPICAQRLQTALATIFVGNTGAFLHPSL